jgi:DNA polymerase epsilon subunit 1
MQVLSLDKTITLEARLLRKDLLHLFEIREFSSDGAFANPSTSLPVKQLSCTECCVPLDIDLCRDTDIVAVDGSLAPKCGNCAADFDRLAIEEKLLADVQRLVVQWMTQDLKCKKCKRVRTNEFMDHCGCAGEWVGTVKREDVVKVLKVYDQVARFYELRMLEGVVGSVMSGL